MLKSSLEMMASEVSHKVSLKATLKGTLSTTLKHIMATVEGITALFHNAVNYLVAPLPKGDDTGVFQVVVILAMLSSYIPCCTCHIISIMIILANFLKSL